MVRHPLRRALIDATAVGPTMCDTRYLMVARIYVGSARAAAVAGLVAWAVVMAFVAAPLMLRVLLIGPLVVVPALLARLPDDRSVGGLSVHRLGGLPALVAALPLVIAIGQPAGPTAAVWTVPRLVLAATGVLAAMVHGVPRLPGLLHPRQAAEVGLDVALGFLGVGALFLSVERLGLRRWTSRRPSSC